MIRIAGVVLSLAMMLAPESSGHVASSGSAPAAAEIVIQAQRGVPASRVDLLRQQIAVLRPIIDADFGVRDDPLLTVWMYATEDAFAGALRRLEGVRPERSGDSVGNVVAGILPLGPPNALLRHNLAHVYTEWVLDRLTGNRSDRQPGPAWLYDGIAEWEANRRSTPVPCSFPGGYPLPLASLAAPTAWWRVRGGLYQGIEYCEAEDAAGRIIRRVGPHTFLIDLHQSHIWPRFAALLLGPTPNQKPRTDNLKPKTVTAPASL